MGGEDEKYILVLFGGDRGNYYCVVSGEGGLRRLHGLAKFICGMTIW